MKLRLPECFRPVLPLLLLFVSAVSFARQASNGLVMDSVDPASDAKALKQMRAYLNKVRTSQNRPTVALVLSGGGAKGAAEVGALKYMEELGIPVDIIFGTSIGGLLGGLYAVGYDADFLDTLITTVDWEKILSDKVDPAVIPLSEKKFKARYQLSIPFHYSKKTQERILPTENYSHSDAKIKLNKSEDDINTQKGMTAVMSGLPSGYVYGFNVNNLLSSLTVGYHDSISFSKLPIPFYCVATELVSCRERNWTSGELKTAMRSTMSIPGLFSPVRIGDEVLMDGGSQNNFPADIAKAAGADIIIGIDLADAFLTSKQIDNMAKVLLQYTDLPSRRAYETTKEMVDVLIKPDLTGYSMLSFNKAAVDTMIARGRVAAIAVDDQLRSVAERVKGKTTKLHNRPAVNINNTKVRISEAVFDGLSHNDAQVLRRKVNINEDAPLDAAMLERAASIIQATGAVESVTYSLLGTQEPYRLVFECTPAPTHNLGASIRLDTEVWAEIGLNLGLNTNRLSGPKFETDLKLGKSQMIDAVFYLDYPGVPTFNVEASFANMNMRCTPLNEYSFLNSNRIDAGYLTHEEKIYISSDRLLNIDSQLGFRNVGYFWNTGRFSEIPFDSSGNYIGAFLDANYSNFDRQYFPNRGVDVKVGCNIDFYKAGVKTFQPIYAFNVDVRGVIPLGLDNLKLIPDFHCRGVFDAFASSITSPEYSFAHRNCLGGDLAGRYISQQVPFVGFNDMGICYKVDGDDASGYVSYDHLAVLNLELRVGVIKNLYVSALGGYAHMAPTTGEFFCYRNHRDIFGAALQVAYNTIVGPIKARFSWSDRSPSTKDNFGFYISAGFDF